MPSIKTQRSITHTYTYTHQRNFSLTPITISGEKISKKRHRNITVSGYSDFESILEKKRVGDKITGRKIETKVGKRVVDSLASSFIFASNYQYRVSSVIFDLCVSI